MPALSAPAGAWPSVTGLAGHKGWVYTSGRQAEGGTDSSPWTPWWPHSLYALPAPFSLAKITGALTCAGLLSFLHLCLPHLSCPLCPLTCALLLCCCSPIRFLFPVPLPWVTAFLFLSQFPVLVSPPTWPHRRLKLRQPVKLHLPTNCSYFSRAIPFSNQLPVGNPDPKTGQVLCSNQGHLEVGVEGGGLV